jgi:hypothetical protein
MAASNVFLKEWENTVGYISVTSAPSCSRHSSVPTYPEQEQTELTEGRLSAGIRGGTGSDMPRIARIIQTDQYCRKSLNETGFAIVPAELSEDRQHRACKAGKPTFGLFPYAQKPFPANSKPLHKHLRQPFVCLALPIHRVSDAGQKQVLTADIGVATVGDRRPGCAGLFSVRPVRCPMP